MYLVGRVNLKGALGVIPHVVQIGGGAHRQRREIFCPG